MDEIERITKYWQGMHMMGFSTAYECAVKEAFEAGRTASLDEAVKACETIHSDRRDAYKGRGKYAPNNPDRASTHCDGESDGALSCTEAIEVIKNGAQPPAAQTEDLAGAVWDGPNTASQVDPCMGLPSKR